MMSCVFERDEQGWVVHVLPLAGYFFAGFTLVVGFLCFFLLPLFDGRSGSEVIGEWLTAGDDTVVVPLGDPPLGEPFDYEYFTPPSNSFGMGETTFKTVNWSYFKSLFLAHTEWSMEYKRYEYSEWTVTPYGEYWWFNRSWNESGFWKFTLFLDVPVDLYSARFTMGIDLPVLDFVERDGWSVWLNYSVGENETYNCFFNWSDMAGIPGIVFNKGMTDDMFWFRFRRDSILAGSYEFDPTFGETGSSISAHTTINYYAKGSPGTPSSGGTVDNITANIWTQSGGGIMKCGLYYYNGTDPSDFIAETEVIDVDTVDEFVTFDFEEPKPSINADQAYLIVVFADTGTYAAINYYNDPGGYVKKYEAMTYPNWEDDVDWDYTYTSGYCLIYASYTEGGGPANNAPVISGEIPANTSTGISLTPTCNVTVTDADAEAMDVTWASNYSNGVDWVNYQTNSSVASGTSPSWVFTGADSYSTRYWWRVFADDGTDNVSSTFYFTTMAEPVPEWHNVTLTINGSYSNTTTFQTVIDSINGTYSNSTAFKTIINTINGSYSNTTVFQTVISTINGTYSNTTAAIDWNTVINTINGSYSNTTTWAIIIDTINGSYSNSTDWETIDNTINGSYSNDTQTWNTVDNTINGSYSNTSTPPVYGNNITITNEYPGNNTVLFALQPTVYFTLDHTGDLPMNYTIYTGNSTVNCTHKLATGSLVYDGTYHYVNYYNASDYDTFYWRVNVTDDVGNSTSETFLFSTRLSGGGGMGDNGMAAVGLCGILGIMGFIGYIRRRRE